MAAIDLPTSLPCLPGFETVMAISPLYCSEAHPAPPDVKLRKGNIADASSASDVSFRLQNALRTNVTECKMRVSNQLKTECKLPLRPADRRAFDD